MTKQYIVTYQIQDEHPDIPTTLPITVNYWDGMGIQDKYSQVLEAICDEHKEEMKEDIRGKSIIILNSMEI